MSCSVCHRQFCWVSVRDTCRDVPPLLWHQPQHLVLDSHTWKAIKRTGDSACKADVSAAIASDWDNE